MNEIHVRSLSERREAALQRLGSTESNLWLATASDGAGPHLIPVSYWWDGTRLLTATFDHSRTLLNIRDQPKVRASIGPTTDVLMIDAIAATVTAANVDEAAAEGYAKASGIPTGTPGFTYIHLVPQRIQVWKGPLEFAGRTVMRGGVWLDDPVD
jgi:hypothetical protein